MTDRNRARRAHALRALSLRALVGCLALALLAGPGVQAAQAADRPPLQGVVNVNTASVQELELLPGIGATRAQAVVDERKRRGGFKSLEELKEVKGIGDASLERLKPYVRFQGKTTARSQ